MMPCLPPPLSTQLCWDCFTKPPPEEAAAMVVINKTRAQTHFLLGAKDMRQLACVVVGPKGKPLETTAMMSRAQAEALAISRYEDGMDGLLADKQKRKVAAEERYKKAVAAHPAKVSDGDRRLSSSRSSCRRTVASWDITLVDITLLDTWSSDSPTQVAAAKAAGKKAPGHPKRSPLMDAEISPTDNGFVVQLESVKRWALTSVGFPGKDDAQPTDDGVIYCRRCLQKVGDEKVRQSSNLEATT